MTSHHFNNFEIQKYYQNKPKFKSVYSRNNLPNNMKDRAYVVNLDEYKSIGTHWIALYGNGNSVTYVDSFGVDHIPEEIKRFMCNSNIITNIFRIQAYDLMAVCYYHVMHAFPECLGTPCSKQARYLKFK